MKLKRCFPSVLVGIIRVYFDEIGLDRGQSPLLYILLLVNLSYGTLIMYKNDKR